MKLVKVLFIAVLLGLVLGTSAHQDEIIQGGERKGQVKLPCKRDTANGPDVVDEMVSLGAVDGIWWYIYTTKVDWNEAKSICEAYDYELAYFESVYQQTDVYAIAPSTYEFVWVDGKLNGYGLSFIWDSIGELIYDVTYTFTMNSLPKLGFIVNENDNYANGYFLREYSIKYYPLCRHSKLPDLN